MDKVFEVCCENAEELVRRRMTPQNLEYLGDYVDICKDIIYMKYCLCKMAMYLSESGGHSPSSGVSHHEITSSRDIDSMIESFKSIGERMRNTGTPEDKTKFKSDAKELLESANKIRSIMSSMPLDADVQARYKELFRG